MKKQKTKTTVNRLEDNQHIVFDHFPIPPSSNSIYKHFLDRRTKKVRRVSTDKLIRFKKDCANWSMINRSLCTLANDYLKNEPFISVEVFVGLHSNTIFTKSGAVRKMDVSNRGKALFDCLSNIIGVDDSHFIDVRLTKYVVSNDTPERCKIILRKASIKTLT